MQLPNLLITLILFLGILGGSQVIAVSAAILVILQFVGMGSLLPFIEDRGLEIGLVFLVMSVLVPFASGSVSNSQALRTCISVPGLIAVFSGVVATHLNGEGLEMLQVAPSVMIGLVLGSIIGVVVFKGIPVGPLMAGGIAALIMRIFHISP